MRNTLIIVLLAAAIALPRTSPAQTPPPPPLLPIPNAGQLAWQTDELRLFVHFGVNTVTDREWGTGEENPAIFNPIRLNTDQWARVAARNGFRAIILTAKHHDGFSLWPSAYSDHTVAGSPWERGAGDVVEELAASVRAEGLRLGLYLSPWDRHEPSYGDQDLYNAFYMAQLQELLTRYGPVHEVWFDGAKGEDARDMEYDFAAYWALVRQLQPEAVMFSDAGPDVRWIGNERGHAGETNWSTYDRSKVGVGMRGIQDYLNQGEPGAPDWTPGECDVSIRPGWFYHPDQSPKTLVQLLDIYYRSVGRNCLLLLNVPPRPDGRFDEADVAALDSLGSAIDSIFGENRAAGSSARVTSRRGQGDAFAGARALDGSLETYWAPEGLQPAGGGHEPSIEILLPSPQTFNVIRLQEPIRLGQRVAAYRVEARAGGEWTTIARGTTIGHKKLDRLDRPITADALRVTIEESLAIPLLAEIGVHLDPNTYTGPE